MKRVPVNRSGADHALKRARLLSTIIPGEFIIANMALDFATVTLESGHPVHLVSILVDFTYSELVEGAVTPKVNNLIMDSWKGSARRHWPFFASIFLNETGLRGRVNGVLPEKVFAGLFETEILDRTISEYSAFAAVWLQEDAHPFLSEENVGCLRQIDLLDVLKQKPVRTPRKKSWFDFKFGKLFLCA